MPTSPPLAFELTSVSKSFGTLNAVKHVDLRVHCGERIALIGPSGSGKSTLLRLLGIQMKHDKGSLQIAGSEVPSLKGHDLKKLRSQTAFIPQNLALVDALKVSQNVLLGEIGKLSTIQTLRQLLWPSRPELERIHQLLLRVGISEKLYHSCRALSGGQQQRVAIARALYQKAATIIADEPVSSIDPTRAHALLTLLEKLNHEENITIICSLHNLEYARQYFPRLIGMRAGQIVFDGAPEEFSKQAFDQLYTLDHG